MLPDVNQISTYMVEFNYELHKYDNSVFNCSKLQNCVQHQLVRNYFIIYTANCPYSAVMLKQHLVNIFNVINLLKM